MSVTATASASSGTRQESGHSASGLAWTALLVAIAGLAGSLSLSWGLHHKPCPLCYYQRSFMMALVAVLGVSVIARAARPGRLGLLALPLTVAGLGVALFHVWLEFTDKLECPSGLLDLGTAPKQSLAVFVVLTALVAVDALLGARGPASWGGLIGGVVLGGLLAAASCTSNPPMPEPPRQPYKSPHPDICRPPYRSTSS
jgi:disulfide bond formation protein DsbB